MSVDGQERQESAVINLMPEPDFCKRAAGRGAAQDQAMSGQTLLQTSGPFVQNSCWSGLWRQEEIWWSRWFKWKVSIVVREGVLTGV